MLLIWSYLGLSVASLSCAFLFGEKAAVAKGPVSEAVGNFAASCRGRTRVGR